MDDIPEAEETDNGQSELDAALEDLGVQDLVEQISGLHSAVKSELVARGCVRSPDLMPPDFGPTVVSALEELDEAARATGSADLCGVGGTFKALAYWAKQIETEDVEEAPHEWFEASSIAGLYDSLMQQGEEDPFTMHNFLLGALGERGPFATIRDLLTGADLTDLAGRKGPGPGGNKSRPVRPIVGGTPTTLDAVLGQLKRTEWLKVLKHAGIAGLAGMILQAGTQGGGIGASLGVGLVWGLGAVAYKVIVRHRFRFAVGICFLLFLVGAVRRHSFEALAAPEALPSLLRGLILNGNVFGFNPMAVCETLGNMAFGFLDGTLGRFEQWAHPVVAGLAYDIINLLILRGFVGKSRLLGNVAVSALLPAAVIGGGFFVASWLNLITGTAATATVTIGMMTAMRCIYFAYQKFTESDLDNEADDAFGAASAPVQVFAPERERIRPYSECAMNPGEGALVVGGPLYPNSVGKEDMALHVARCIALAENARSTAMRIAGA